MTDAVILSSRVRLARNFADMPFDSCAVPEDAARVISRVTAALKRRSAGEGFQLLHLADLPHAERLALWESRLIRRGMLTRYDNAAVLLRDADGCAIMLNGDDNLCIQTTLPGLKLLEAAASCFRVEEAISRHEDFAFDENLGYLTARVTDVGTGLRASVQLHLPMLTTGKKMGEVGQMIARVGLNIRGVYGEGSEALGHVYQISNQVTLGRTEQELVSAVTAAARQLSDMEKALRAKALREARTPLEDLVWRAWGIMNNARLLNEQEFYQHWSYLRLGAAEGLLPLSTDACDGMLSQAQPGHLSAWAEATLEGEKLAEARASRIRELMKS